MASRLRLQEDRIPGPAVSLELMALRDINADIVDYAVFPDSPLVGRTVQQVQVPEGAVLAMISRGTQLIAPRGNTDIQTGDHLFIVTREDTRQQLDRALTVVADT